MGAADERAANGSLAQGERSAPDEARARRGATTLQQLRCFVAVAEEGQITRAASRLHLAQPALSNAIDKLESHLGVKLLERHARGVRLTPGGEAFLGKARAALAAVADAEQVAQSAAGLDAGLLELGFIGPPPPMKAPGMLAAFTETHPQVEVCFRELPFPSGSSSSWLEQIDVAFCHPPELSAGIAVRALRNEPRVLLAPNDHPLAARGELAVADVLDATFLAYHPDVQPSWAAFHSLDDHRGGPPQAMTAERARTSLEMLAMLASGRGVTTLPECDAEVIPKVLPSVVTLPISDARPFTLAMTWREEAHNPHIAALAAIGSRIAEDELLSSGR
jgi:LysR family transcriptional regulator, benzoate and cis,cis-muconate-responsive activator of ben and cat genes